MGIMIKAGKDGAGCPTANVRGCVFEHCQWGAFLGNSLTAEDKRAVTAANTFRHNEISDLTDHFEEYRGAAVQPWRRGALSS